MAWRIPGRRIWRSSSALLRQIHSQHECTVPLISLLHSPRSLSQQYDPVRLNVTPQFFGSVGPTYLDPVQIRGRSQSEVYSNIAGAEVTGVGMNPSPEWCRAGVSKNSHTGSD